MESWEFCFVFQAVIFMIRRNRHPGKPTCRGGGSLEWGAAGNGGRKVMVREWRRVTGIKKKRERNEGPEELMGPTVLLGTQTTLLSPYPFPFSISALLSSHWAQGLMAFPTPKSTWPSYSCEISISVSQVQTFHEGNLIRPIVVFSPPDRRALVHLWLSCPSPEATLA